ncbi:hypothetical protein CBW65_22455 [Tumebacillus avium]|uniref:DNA 3'-5' helicase n=1 Tax=Tumebacillus avium TaxID=1903704 RepID=A0A1Y0IU14_9BACL|nr:helicase-associated domain-containing protein [Tumebacillus avium]ARU63449.1 hypothetical protein CBW65_22455 [Tumebacillus avium]
MYRKPLFVHSDQTIYLIESLDSNREVSEKLNQFSEQVKAPEGVFTFKITPHSIWSAAARKLSSSEIISFLKEHSQNHIQPALEEMIHRHIKEFGTLKLIRSNDYLDLEAIHPSIISKIQNETELIALEPIKVDDRTLRFTSTNRSKIKETLFNLNFFVSDESNTFGEPLEIRLNPKTKSDMYFTLRPYQDDAVNSYLEYSESTGGGVIMMPPTSGKTIVGLKIIEQLKTCTLVLVENFASGSKWLRELSDKTDLSKNSIGYFQGDPSDIKPITIAEYPQFKNIDALESIQTVDWGLIIYDNAHRLPADTFSQTVDIPSYKKLGFASTLARSDQKGQLVHAWIGPKLYEILPRTLEIQGFVKSVSCMEVRIPLQGEDLDHYNYSRAREDTPSMLKIAAMNPNKITSLKPILVPNMSENILIVSYKPALAKQISNEFDYPFIHTSTLDKELQSIIDLFNLRKKTRLVTTSISEQIPITSIDVMVALSYNHGSEREEYLRVGKLMFPEKGTSKGVLVSFVSENTVEEGAYTRRRRSMIRNGYRYKITSLSDLLEGKVTIWD